MSYTVAIMLLSIGIAVLAATIVAAIAGILFWMDGASVISALSRAGVAFAGTVTLAVLIIGLLGEGV